MSTGKPKDGDLQVVSQPDKSKPPLPLAASASNALVEYTPVVFKEEEEDLEVKLRRIIDNVPVRVSNTSGSSAGSGSGDFHQVKLSKSPLLSSYAFERNIRFFSSSAF